MNDMQNLRGPAVQGGTAIPQSPKELILRMLWPFKRNVFLFFFITFLGILALTATPLIIARVVTELAKSHTVDRYVWEMVVLYGLLRLADEACWRIGEIIARSVKPQMIESVRMNLYAATLKKSHTYFVNSSSGRIGHWINQTTETMSDTVDITIWNVWGRLIGLIISAAFLFTVHWSVALLFILWLLALFTFNIYRGKEFSRLVADQSDEASKASGMVVDTLSNHVSVRVFGAQASERRSLASQQAHIIRKWRRSWGQNIVTNAVKGQSAFIVGTAALVLILSLFSHGVVRLGAIVLFVAYFGEASVSLWELAWSTDVYYRNFGTVQNALDNLRGSDERVVEKTTQTAYRADTVDVELKDLCFAYPEQSDELVLNRLNLRIADGEKVGVVGHSGAGKSTLVGLLLGLYEPTKGTILLNGESTADRGPTFIRSFSSFVPQDTNLFNRSIRENVVYARPDATDEMIATALEQAQAAGFVDKLPNKLDSVIGERGVKLSGGQRQRIAIARAILQNAPLLILDEATSALDSVSEQAIQKALRDLMQHRTSIVIAHRLSTLRNLDRIIVLAGGNIAEQGTHAELIAENGIYADLWKRQKDGFVAG